MAQVLKFRRNVTDLNLLDSSGFHLLDPGWVPQVAGGGEDAAPVEEVLLVQANYSSQDNLAAGLVTLNKLRRDVRRYMVDRLEEYPVWLHDKLNSETGERRALVRRISVKQLTEQHGVSGEGSMIDAKPVYELGVERGPYWERTEARSLPAATPSAAASITYDYTAAGGAVGAHDVVGDAPARLELFDFYPFNFTLAKVWMGIRSANKHGTLANFVNVWELEDGVNGTDASDVVDADASGGNAVQVSPGTATWAKRSTITLATVSANEVDNYGSFLWLLRTEVSAGTWEVQMRWGYDGMEDDDMVQGEIKEVDWTSYDYVALGNADIPGRDLHCIPRSLYNDEKDKTWQIQVWARRTDGSGTLKIDCLCPIPLDEGYLMVWDMAVASGTSGHVFFSEASEGRRQVMTYDSGYFAGFVPFAADNFRLPPGDGRLVIVSTATTGSALGGALYLNESDGGKYYERWTNLRGAE